MCVAINGFAVVVVVVSLCEGSRTLGVAAAVSQKIKGPTGGLEE